MLLISLHLSALVFVSFPFFLSPPREARLSSSNSPSVPVSVFLLSSFAYETFFPFFYNPCVPCFLRSCCCLPFRCPDFFSFPFRISCFRPWVFVLCVTGLLMRFVFPYTPWAGILRKVSYSQIFSHEAVKLKSCSLF